MGPLNNSTPSPEEQTNEPESSCIKPQTPSTPESTERQGIYHLETTEKTNSWKKAIREHWDWNDLASDEEMHFEDIELFDELKWKDGKTTIPLTTKSQKHADSSQSAIDE